MNILLLNPPAEYTIKEYPDESGSSFIETEDFGKFPPLGLLYVLSYAERHSCDHEFFFQDCVGESISHAQLSDLILDIHPDLVGITSFTISLVDVCTAARTIRRVVPNAHICLGGHHPIAFPFEAAALKEFDSIVVGEGEVAFTKLIEALAEKRNITGIEGVYTTESIKKWEASAYHDNRFLSRVMVPPAYIEDIDTLPFPNREHIRHIRYNSIVGASSKLATIISSRGCPYRCIYCDVPYKQYRERSITEIVNELEECLAMGYDEFHFYDDLFNISVEKVNCFCDEVERRKLKFAWNFRGRVNGVTLDSLERASRAGCRMISFGVETGTDEGLKQLRKQTDTKTIKKVFQWCRQLGIKTVADFMIGLPFEQSVEDIWKNLEFLMEIDPDYAQICILSIYPNTEVYDMAVKRNIVEENRWREFALDPQPDFKIDHWNQFITRKELVSLQKKAYQKFYFRPTHVFKSVINTRSVYEFLAKTKGLLKLMHG